MLTRFGYYLARKNLAATTQRHYKQAVTTYLSRFDALTDKNTEKYLFEVLQSSTPANHNRHLKALKHAYECFEIPFPSYIKKLAEKPQPRISITDEEIEAILGIDPPPNRFGVFFSVLSYTGARPAEILGLKVEDVDMSAHLLYIRESKTGSREIPILEPLQDILYPYCQSITGKLFPFTNTAYLNNWRHRLKVLGITKHVKPYSMRRSFITKTLSQGGSLFAVQDIVGHRKSETTRAYYHGNVDLMREAAQLLPRAAKSMNPWITVQQILSLVRKHLSKRDDVSVDIHESDDEVLIRIRRKVMGQSKQDNK